VCEREEEREREGERGREREREVQKHERKVKTGHSLSKTSKPTALHTEGTAQVSEWLNISDTAKKLY